MTRSLEQLLQEAVEFSADGWSRVPRHEEDANIGSDWYGYAVLKSDPSIALRWGPTLVSPFREDWSDEMTLEPDTNFSALAEFLLNGAPIHQFSYVVTDRGRIFSPMPHMEFGGGDPPAVTRLWATTWHANAVAIISDLGGGGDSPYSNTSGIEIIPGGPFSSPD